jgi:hypothetical protein
VIKPYLMIGYASSEKQGITETETVSEMFDLCSELPQLISEKIIYQ